MLKELPRLPRQPIRPEEEPGLDKECWRPTWKCFCCEDTGFVVISLVRLVIPDYDHHRDKPVVCNNCSKRQKFGETIASSLDWRFNEAICQKLDLISREDWAQTLRKWHEQRFQGEQIDLSGIGKNLRKRSRTPEEEMMAQQKHQAVLAQMNAGGA